MSRGRRGNLLVMQSGGPTPVINQSLAGVVHEALAAGAFDGVYGAVKGMDGLLHGQLVDLGRQPARLWAGVRRAPGLPSGRPAGVCARSSASRCSRCWPGSACGRW